MTETTRAEGMNWVAPLCWAAVVLDGFDLVVLGALIPVLTGGDTPWMTAPQATFVSTISLVGMTLGALSIGIATDRLGRRKLLIATVLAFSLLTLACGFARSPTQLALFRFLAGFGLGGCLPTAIAMVTEFSRGQTGKASTTLMTGYHVGAVATALIALILLPHFGWRGMFVVGAIPGLILVPLMYMNLPESPSFLLAKGRRGEAEAIARANGLTLDPAVSATATAPQSSSGALLREPFLKNSIAIWVTSFMGLLLVYALNTWLPKLMVAAGYGLSGGLWQLLLLNVGAICGLLVAGRVGDRVGLKPAAVVWFTAGGILLALLSVRMTPALLYPVVFLTGCFVFSAQVLVYAFVAANHPAGIRATALGMAAGVGRLGAIAGPLIGGTLVSMGLGHPWGFYVFAVVGFLGAIAIASTTVMKARA